MAASYRKIDYALRPAKHAERRMLCDIFRRLTFFDRLSNYTYVGFGGIAFSDFILFHKALGIKDMISIEQTAYSKPRVENNKPFNTIQIKNNRSSDILPKLRWKKRHILWLDYDDPLKNDMFLDVRTVANKACSGTALALTFKCHEALEIAAAKIEKTDPLEKFISTFSRERVPPETDAMDLKGWPYGELGCRMLINEIRDVLSGRNASLADTKHIAFQEICTVEYSDNAEMITFVGVFVAAEDQQIIEKCDFTHLDFIPTEAKPILIEIPMLTNKEIKSLEKQLPRKEGDRLDGGSIPPKEIQAFEKLYRYLPNFAVLES